MTVSPKRLLVFAPNWLGDAVMAVPCLEALRRYYPAADVCVAARAHLAPLFEMVAGVGEVIPLRQAGPAGGWFSALQDARRLRDGRFEVAILLPNSFRAAWIASRTRIPERWGYAADLRSRWLTQSVTRVRGGHQVEYYQRLLRGLGIVEGKSAEAAAESALARPIHLDVPGVARDWARETLTARGWTAGTPLVGMAPGAAYGTAKQWPPDRFAQLAAQLDREGVRTVLVGSGADKAVCDAIERGATSHLAPRTSHFVMNLVGATDLKQLAAVMAECRTFVSNDSGAMHLAAAVGGPVVAIFGSTNETETAPLPSPETRPGLDSNSAYGAGAKTDMRPGFISHAIVATAEWCRPCMLRECPIEHRCMTAIGVERVLAEVQKRLEI